MVTSISLVQRLRAMVEMAARRRDEESSLSGYENEFLRASEELKTAALRNEVTLSDAQKIKFYSLFKQATEGNCTKPQPSAFKPVERAKWNGWKALEGMDMTMAKRRYVLQVIELVPSFKMPTEPAPEPVVPVTQPSQVSVSSTPEVSGNQAAVPASTSSTMLEHPAVRRRQGQAAPRPQEPLIQRQQRRASVPSYSYSLIFLELLAMLLATAIAVIGGAKFLVPLCHQVAADHLGLENCNGLKSLSPVLWFGMGYLLVSVLRKKVFEWRLLTGEFVWTSALAPMRRLRRFRHQQRQQSTQDIEKARFLSSLGIHLVKEPEGSHDRWVTPRLELVLPKDPEAMSFGHATVDLPFTVEQTSEVYYRKFKEPLPDPANHLLVALEDIEVNNLEEWDAVYRCRLMRFRNATPYLIKRFVSSDYVEYLEYSLFDKRNRVFYVYVKNKSFDTLGTIEDYSVYQPTDGNPEWTTLTQTARVHITSSSIGFFRSQIESFISTFYGKQAPKARQYHLIRLAEEFGMPDGLPAPPSLV